MTAKKRYEVGLSKLATTESSVASMQAELIALQPQLEESTKQTEAALVVIERETVEADKVKKVGNMGPQIADVLTSAVSTSGPAWVAMHSVSY